jgi:hypothetical protein
MNSTTDKPNTLSIRPRRDYEEKWLENNPVLKEKEMVVSINKDTICYKLGNGKSSYSELPFVDLFKALMLGYVYLPESTIINGVEKIQLTLIDKEIMEYYKENDFTTIYDVYGRTLINKSNN